MGSTRSFDVTVKDLRTKDAVGGVLTFELVLFLYLLTYDILVFYYSLLLGTSKTGTSHSQVTDFKNELE